MTEILNIKDLHANAGDKEILKGLNLKINAGEIHVIMGPNGAGKSTLANVIFNNPVYKKISGEIDFIGENINDLKTKYDLEMKRVENEFNQKYEQFLAGQHDFAPTILQKRQAELQDLMEKNIAFKQKAQQLLKDAEANAFAPVNQRLDAVIQRVGQALGLAFVLNTDNHAVPFINTLSGVDVTATVVDAVK